MWIAHGTVYKTDCMHAEMQVAQNPVIKTLLDWVNKTGSANLGRAGAKLGSWPPIGQLSDRAPRCDAGQGSCRCNLEVRDPYGGKEGWPWQVLDGPGLSQIAACENGNGS